MGTVSAAAEGDGNLSCISTGTQNIDGPPISDITGTSDGTISGSRDARVLFQQQLDIDRVELTPPRLMVSRCGR